MSKTPYQHDAAYKNLFTDPEMVASLLRRFVPADIVAEMDFSSLEPFPADHIAEDRWERRNDIVWRVRLKESFCYLLFLLEFQSREDWWMAVRILAYTALLWQDIIKADRLGAGDRLPPVFPLVLYNGGKAWKAPTDLRDLLLPHKRSLNVLHTGKSEPATNYTEAAPDSLEKMSAEQGPVLTEAQVQALERKKQDDEASGEIESHHPDYLDSQDTFYVGTLKGVGRSYQQTFVDTYSKWATAKLYTTRTLITGTDLLNDRVLPFFASQQMGIIRILTDRGTEYRGKLETHDYQLYLGVNGIEHTRTKARHPQTNGTCERFHKTILHEFYQVAFRRKLYPSVEELQNDLDIWLEHYNTERTHQGEICCGRTSMQTLLDGKKLWNEKVEQLN